VLDPCLVFDHIADFEVLCLDGVGVFVVRHAYMLPHPARVSKDSAHINFFGVALTLERACYSIEV
jgi:hypothetical protein